jgi:hypothetical protein
VIVIVGWVEPNRREEFMEEKRIKQPHSSFISPHDTPTSIEHYKGRLFPLNLFNDELAHYKSICYMVTLQEFLKSKNIKYLFFQPWYDLLGIVDAPKKLISFPVGDMKNIIEKIDQKYCIGPVNGFTSSKEWMRFIHHREGTLFGNIYEALIGNVGKWRMDHPMEEHHKIMYEVIKEKLLEIYDV